MDGGSHNAPERGKRSAQRALGHLAPPCFSGLMLHLGVAKRGAQHPQDQLCPSIAWTTHSVPVARRADLRSAMLLWARRNIKTSFQRKSQALSEALGCLVFCPKPRPPLIFSPLLFPTLCPGHAPHCTGPHHPASVSGPLHLLYTCSTSPRHPQGSFPLSLSPSPYEVAPAPHPACPLGTYPFFFPSHLAHYTLLVPPPPLQWQLRSSRHEYLSDPFTAV